MGRPKQTPFHTIKHNQKPHDVSLYCAWQCVHDGCKTRQLMPNTWLWACRAVMMMVKSKLCNRDRVQPVSGISDERRPWDSSCELWIVRLTETPVFVNYNSINLSMNTLWPFNNRQWATELDLMIPKQCVNPYMLRDRQTTKGKSQTSQTLTKWNKLPWTCWPSDQTCSSLVSLVSVSVLQF